MIGLKKLVFINSFIRLLLILRSLHVNQEKIKIILKPNRKTVSEKNHLWSTLTREECVKVEVELKNLILNDYKKKINVKNRLENKSNNRNIYI